MSVEKYGDKFRVRRVVRGRRKTLKVVATEVEAHAWDAEFARQLAEAPVGETLKSWGEAWLDERERDGIRSVEDDRSRWRTHVEGSDLINLALVSITPERVTKWVKVVSAKKRSDGQRLSPLTIRSIIGLLKHCLAAAVPVHLTASPFDGVPKELLTQLKKRRPDQLGDPWTYLELAEQERLLSCAEIPEAHRLMIAVAIYTGMRQGEMYSLRLSEVRIDGGEPSIVVRRGSEKYTTKNGKVRHVQLIPAAVKVLRRWLKLLPRYCPKNPKQLVFPRPTGARASEGKHALYGPEPGAVKNLRGPRVRALGVLAQLGPATASEFGRAMWPSADWEHRQNYLVKRTGLMLRRLAQKGLAEVNDARWRLTLEGRQVRDLGAPEGRRTVDLFPHYLALAGIVPEQRHDGRHVRWHDLRHTFCSSLVAGWWGRRWTLEEVKAAVGHSTIQMTERYTHLARSALKAAAAATCGTAVVGAASVAPDPEDDGPIVVPSAENRLAPPAGIGPATFGLGNRCSIH